MAKYFKIIRYLISGGTATAVDLGFLYVFTSLFHINYLLSSVLAFLLAFGVSFFLQKFWTFADRATDRMKSQLVIYFIITSINLGINTLLMYFFVDFFHIQYILAQIITAGLVACESYFVFQIFVFRPS